MHLRCCRSASASARSAMSSGVTLPSPRCSGFWRRCSASPSCAAWRCARRCCRRPDSGRALRPALGGLGVGLLALLTPQVMSSGHGALHFAGFVSMPLAAIAGIFVLKAIAAVISLGSGFRGGLFFATLFLGALGGHLFAAGFDTIWPGLNLDPNLYAIVGMSALSASVIGGPLTMSFIALESTGQLWLPTAPLVAGIITTP